ncbi:MAG: ATP synthase F1 subunit gamma [Deferribacteres bacterium]|nr:ATP synthase F1 subunit gamma [candidate division KSB1 bacterium]MCB9511743.1 ATP synthase F1 subunit gamma [Deferribacteres bacterium]
MATLRDIRRKITSVKKTQQITKAMKMVAAAKLRRAQARITQIRPYAETLSAMLSNVASKVDHSLNKFLQERPVKNVAVIVVAADRGLCGSFNANVIRHAKNEIDKLVDEGKTVTLVTAGKKAFEFFSKRDYAIDHKLSGFFNHLAFEHALDISQYVQSQFVNGAYDQIVLIYTKAESAVKQHIMVEQLLPIKPQELDEEQGSFEYIFEPGPGVILDKLCPKSVNIRVWQAMAESYYGEEGARMMAMDNATENAQEMINNLTLHYNKARQAAITKEINEIVGGAEALK